MRRSYLRRAPVATPGLTGARRLQDKRLVTAMETELRRKQITPDDAAALVKSGVWVGQPDLFDQALARRKDELRGVRIRGCASFSPRAILEADPTGDHFLWFNWHFSAYERGVNQEGRCNYIPMNFGEAPAYYRR